MAGTTTTGPPRQGVIPNPVPGGTFTDTFGACRGGAGCPRKHMGVDIFAPAGTAVDSPVTGKVVKAGPDGGNGGNRVWVAGDDGRFYYFAHLRDIVATTGETVKVGTKLGTVGNTGDAAGGSTHLHFSINKAVGAEDPVVNPYLVINKTAGAGPSTPSIGRDYAGRPINTAPPTSTTTGEGAYGDAASSNCADQPPVIRFPGVAGVGAVTVLSRCQARALVGGLSMAAGGLLMVGGVALLAVYGFQSNAARLALQTVGAPGQLVDQRRTKRAAAGEREESADVRAAQRSASMAGAQARQEAAEARMVRSRQTSGPGPRSTTRRPRTGTEDF